MFHIFISYAHEDGRDYRDTVINLLKKNGFKDDDYWIDDRDINLGEEWRTEIDKSLNESFIVLIILTKGAVKSHYVTYEWSRAIGDGITTIPIIFENLPKKFPHPLLERKQFVDWRKADTPEKVIKAIKLNREMPPDTVYLNRLITRIILPFRLLAKIAIWVRLEVEHDLIEHSTRVKILRALLDELTLLVTSKLPDFIVSKSSSFSRRNLRTCYKLIESLETFRNVFNFGERELHDWEMPLSQQQKLFFDSIEPTMEQLHAAENFRQQNIEKLASVFQKDTYQQRQFIEFEKFLLLISKNMVLPSDLDEHLKPFVYLSPGVASHFLLAQTIEDKEIAELVINTIDKIYLKRLE